MIQLEDSALKDLAETKLFKQYKMRISSKRDPEGNIKHNIVGRVNEINV